MDDTTILGSALGQLGQTIKKAGQQVVKLPEEVSKDVVGQVGGEKPAASSVEGSTSPKQEQKQWQSDEERIKFLKGLYGPSDVKQESSKQETDNKKTSANPLVSSAQEKPSKFQEQIADKSPEEQKKLMELRQQLHKDYYDALVNPPKPKEKRPAEKVENEKKQEMQDLQQKEATKPPPLAVVREQNKAEMFRGAAG